MLRYLIFGLLYSVCFGAITQFYRPIAVSAQNINQQPIINPSMIPPNMRPDPISQNYNGQVNSKLGSLSQAAMNAKQEYGPNNGRNQLPNLPLPGTLRSANQVNLMNGQQSTGKDANNKVMNPTLTTNYQANPAVASARIQQFRPTDKPAQLYNAMQQVNYQSSNQQNVNSNVKSAPASANNEVKNPNNLLNIQASSQLSTTSTLPTLNRPNYSPQQSVYDQDPSTKTGKFMTESIYTTSKDNSNSLSANNINNYQKTNSNFNYIPNSNANISPNSLSDTNSNTKSSSNLSSDQIKRSNDNNSNLSIGTTNTFTSSTQNKVNGQNNNLNSAHKNNIVGSNNDVQKSNGNCIQGNNNIVK